MICFGGNRNIEINSPPKIRRNRNTAGPSAFTRHHGRYRTQNYFCFRPMYRHRPLATQTRWEFVGSGSPTKAECGHGWPPLLGIAHGRLCLLRRPASGHCLCNGHHVGRRLLSVTTACLQRPLASYNGRRHRRRPLSVTAAAIAAARFL
jgi:hypothetical protein